jgi:hypothetical protein
LFLDTNFLVHSRTALTDHGWTEFISNHTNAALRSDQLLSNGGLTPVQRPTATGLALALHRHWTGIAAVDVRQR